MNTCCLNSLIAIIVCCLICFAACGGTVVSQTESEPSTTPTVDAGPESAPQPAVDAAQPIESGPDAVTSDAEAEAEVKPPTDAKPPVILSLEFAGAVPPIQTAGSSHAVLFRYTACATKNVLLTIQEFMVYRHQEARTQGTLGTFYFRNFFAADDSDPNGQKTWAGPEELFAVQNKPQPERVRLLGAYPVMANTCSMLALIADLSSNQDAPGEFLGATYQIGLVGQAATVLAGGDEPQDREIKFDEILFGKLTGEAFTVSEGAPVN